MLDLQNPQTYIYNIKKNKGYDKKRYNSTF